MKAAMCSVAGQQGPVATSRRRHGLEACQHRQRASALVLVLLLSISVCSAGRAVPADDGRPHLRTSSALQGQQTVQRSKWTRGWCASKDCPSTGKLLAQVQQPDKPARQPGRIRSLREWFRPAAPSVGAAGNPAPWPWWAPAPPAFNTATPSPDPVSQEVVQQVFSPPPPPPTEVPPPNAPATQQAGGPPPPPWWQPTAPPAGAVTGSPTEQSGATRPAGYVTPDYPSYPDQQQTGGPVPPLPSKGGVVRLGSVGSTAPSPPRPPSPPWWIPSPPPPPPPSPSVPSPPSPPTTPSPPPAPSPPPPRPPSPPSSSPYPPTPPYPPYPPYPPPPSPQPASDSPSYGPGYNVPRPPPYGAPYPPPFIRRPPPAQGSQPPPADVSQLSPPPAGQRTVPSPPPGSDPSPVYPTMQVFLAGSLTSQSMNQMLSTFSLVTSQTAFGVSSQPQMTNVLSVTDPTMPPPPPSPTAQTPGGRRLLSVATHDNTDSGDNTNTLDTQGQARSVSAAGKDTADRHTRVSRGLLQAVAGQQDAARLQPDQQSVAQGVSENVCEAEGAPGQLGRRHLAEGGKRRLAQTGFVPQPLPGTSGVGVVFQLLGTGFMTGAQLNQGMQTLQDAITSGAYATALRTAGMPVTTVQILASQAAPAAAITPAPPPPSPAPPTTSKRFSTRETVIIAVCCSVGAVLLLVLACLIAIGLRKCCCGPVQVTPQPNSLDMAAAVATAHNGFKHNSVVPTGPNAQGGLQWAPVGIVPPMMDRYGRVVPPPGGRLPPLQGYTTQQPSNFYVPQWPVRPRGGIGTELPPQIRPTAIGYGYSLQQQQDATPAVAMVYGQPPAAPGGPEGAHGSQ